MNWKKLTGIIILVIAAGLIIYDCFAYAHGPGATISEVIHEWSGRYPLLPATIGGLIVHLFGAETRI